MNRLSFFFCRSLYTEWKDQKTDYASLKINTLMLIKIKFLDLGNFSLNSING